MSDEDEGAWTSVRLPRWMKEQIEHYAGRESRNFSGQVRQFIREGIERRTEKVDAETVQAHGR